MEDRWWPEEEWTAMRAGGTCPMCADAHLPVNEHGELIAERPGSYVRLARNQTHSGYTVVILKRHAVELHDLAPDELRRFWTDVAAVGQVVTSCHNEQPLPSWSWPSLDEWPRSGLFRSTKEAKVRGRGTSCSHR